MRPQTGQTRHIALPLHLDLTHEDMARIEIEARRLRAEYTRNAVRALGRMIAGVFAPRASGRTA